VLKSFSNQIAPEHLGGYRLVSKARVKDWWSIEKFEDFETHFRIKIVLKTLKILWGDTYSCPTIWRASWNFPTDHQTFSRAIYFNCIMWQFEKENIPPKLFSWHYIVTKYVIDTKLFIQPNNFIIMDWKIRLLSKKIFKILKKSFFDLEVLFSVHNEIGWL
jgi:hypothetical protein